VVARYRWWVVEHPWRWAAAYGCLIGVIVFLVSLPLGLGFLHALREGGQAAAIVFAIGGPIRSSRFYQRRERAGLGSQ
jgi:hypothetical protein